VGTPLAEHVVGVPERARERHHDPAPQPFRHAPRRLPDLVADHGGPPEIGVAGVEDDGLPRGELVVQDGAQARVPALGHPAEIDGGRLVVVVVVDVEVIGLEDLEIGAPVPDPVLPEILRLGGGGDETYPEQNRNDAGHGDQLPVEVSVRNPAFLHV